MMFPTQRRMEDPMIQIVKKKPPLTVVTSCQGCQRRFIAFTRVQLLSDAQTHKKITGHDFYVYARYSGATKLGEYLWVDL